MISGLVNPLINPLLDKTKTLCERYGLASLSMLRILRVGTFVTAFVFAALQIGLLAAVFYVLHLLLNSVKYRLYPDASNPIKSSLTLFGAASAMVFASIIGAKGIESEFSTAGLFLLLAWIVQAHTLLYRPAVFHIVDGAAVAMVAGLIILLPSFIPAIAILGGLASLISCALALFFFTTDKKQEEKTD